VAACAVVGATVGIVMTAMRTPEYAARMSVFFPARASVLGSTGLGEGGSLGAAAMLGSSGPSPLRIFQAFLESETAVSDIRKAFNFKRKDLLENRALDADPRTNVLTVTFIDPDPKRAQRVLHKHVEELRRINSKVSFNTMEDDLRVIRNRLDQARRKMSETEAKLVAYQRNTISAPTVSTGPTGVSSTPASWAQSLIQLQMEQERIDRTLSASKARVQALAKMSSDVPSELPPIKRLRPKLLDISYELELKRRTLGPQAPEVTRLEAQLRVTQKALTTELQAYMTGVNTNLIDPSTPEGQIPALLTSRTVNDAQISVLRRLAQAAPTESMQLNRLYSQINLQAGIVQTLTTQYLTASLQAQRDPNRWVILDEPWVDDRPVNKSFGRTALVGAFLGLFVGVALAVIRRP
jgi:uncharacterized protein involved in exopolysaccharide biosynthesis